MASLRLQDGRTINFPDGLTQEQVESIVAAASPQPQTVAPGKTDLQHAPSLTRTAGLGARAIGRGVGADMLGLLGDIRETNDYLGTKVVNSGVGAINKGISPIFERMLANVGAPVDIPDVPEMPSGVFSKAIGVLPGMSGPTSDEIAGAAEEIGQGIGIDLPAPETSGERLFSSIMRFGSQAATGGTGLARAATGKAAAELPALLRAYAGPSAKRAIAGDIGAGSGTGAALHMVDEYAPEAVASNPLVRLATALAGGIAGKSLPSLARSPAAGFEKAAGWLRDTDPVLRDSSTGAAPRRRNVQQAAEFLQKGASDPKAAVNAIERNQSYFETAGGAMPTSGLMSDDLGLQMLEKAQRQANPKPFLERDKALRGSAAADLARLRPDGSDPNAARDLAKGTIATKRGEAEQAVEGAQARLDSAQAEEKALMQNYQPYGGGASVASEDLDRAIVGGTLRPMQKTKNDLYEAVDPEGTVMRSTEPLAQLAAALRGEAEGLPPTVQRQVLPEALLSDFEATTKPGGEGAMSFRDLNKTRSAIADMEREARAGGNSVLADTLLRVKNTITEDTKALASEGSDAGQRALEAHRFYKEEFAPLFAQREGGKLRKDINRDDFARTNTPPTATAQRFLRPESRGKEAAEDLQRIIAKTPNPREASDAARRYVLADMVSTVGADGKVSEPALRRWINARTGMLTQIPTLEKEIRGLLDEVTRRSTATGTMHQELKNAVAGRARTRAEIDRSALSLFLDADPKNTAARVLSSPDPVAAADEIQAAFKGVVPAERGWRAAVADHLVESLGASGKAGIANDLDAISLDRLTAAFRKNEPALRTIFGDADMQYLNQARHRLELLSNKSVQAARGAGDIPKSGLVNLLKKPLDVILRLTYGALEGGSRMRKYNVLAEQLPDTNAAASELVRRAMFDPEVAKHLLTRQLKDIGSPAWNKKLNQLMGWAEAGRAVGDRD